MTEHAVKNLSSDPPLIVRNQPPSVVDVEVKPIPPDYGS